MRVSVTIPTYNRPDYLTRALSSLASQTHADWESLVVDDGDGLGAEAARLLGDPRVHTARNRRQGQISARNAALALATGEVIAWLDDDDAWEDAWHLERVVRTLADGPALVHQHGWVVREEGGVETSHERFTLPASRDILRRDNTLLTSSVAYPRALHAELGPFDEAVGGYFDWDWYLRVLGAGYPLVTLGTPGVVYTLHAGSGSAEVLNPRRVRDFGAFARKHALEPTIKNHASLLAGSDQLPA